MKTSAVWRIVALREIFTKLRDKTFLFSTFFTLLMLIASLGINAFVSNQTHEAKIAVVSANGQKMVAATKASLEASDSKEKLSAQNYDSETAAMDAVRSDDMDAALIQAEDGWKLTFHKGADQEVVTPLTQTIAKVTIAENAQAQGINLAQLSQGSKLETAVLSGEDHSMMAFIVGLAFAMVFYMAVILFGQIIAMSVVEEKQNRIVEIIATAIPIGQLLAGKIVGNTVLAVSQVALYAIVGLTGLNITGATDKFGWVLGSASWFVLFYVVGFVALATIWAAVGAMASRSEDISSTSAPVTMLTVAMLFGGIYAKGSALAVLSFVPVASSIAMPMRLLTEDVPFWQPLLALFLTLVATFFLTNLGAKIYRNNIMRGGSAVTWKQVLTAR